MQHCWEDLANEIIVRAVKDYRAARKKVRARPDQKAAQATIRELERFFRSWWFAQLTDVDGEMLLQRLQKEVVL